LKTEAAIGYETIIGLEVHAQLLTHSKMYCRCSADYSGAEPNTHVCPVCLGMPGVLPVINERAIEFTVMTGLALNCEIAELTKFDRKNYPYPDLMKGYQISQYDLPLCRRGWLDLEVDGVNHRIGITRVHLEEDVAKLIHRSGSWGEAYSLVDVNRAGVPLMEIVSEPDIRSPEEARQYLIKLRSILQYLGVSTGSMEAGSFRCDANISIRPVGSTGFFTKVEVKNMNSFRSVYRALEYEAKRQREVVESGGRIVQETRGWLDDRGETVSQRTKEYAHDYRYFPEPDLPPLVLSRAWVEEVKAKLPELPEARRERLMAQYSLSVYDANLLTDSKAMADFFEEATRSYVGNRRDEQEKRAKVVSNWLLGEFSRLLNVTDGDVAESRLAPRHLVEMLELVDKGTLSVRMAKEVFEEMFRTGRTAGQIVAEKGLAQVSDVAELEAVVERVLASSPQPVADYRAGKEQAISFLMGQVMKETRGRANPATVNKVLREKLAALG